MILNQKKHTKSKFKKYISHNNSTTRSQKHHRNNTNTQQIQQILNIINKYQSINLNTKTISLTTRTAQKHPNTSQLHLYKTQLLFTQNTVTKTTNTLNIIIHNQLKHNLSQQNLHLIHHLLHIIKKKHKTFNILKKIPSSQQSLTLSLELINLPLHIKNTTTTQQKINRILKHNAHNIIRTTTNHTFLKTKLLNKTTKFFHETLQPNQKTTSIEISTQTLLIIKKLQKNTHTPKNIQNRITTIYKNLQQFHQTITQIFYNINHFKLTTKHTNK